MYNLLLINPPHFPSITAFSQRGKFRPKLQTLVESNPQDLVARSTSDAVKCLPDIEKAIETLTALKGVGPATASGNIGAPVLL